jgi:adenylate cyclase
VERSTELEAVVGRTFAAINARDTATFLNLNADEPGALFIGTDPEEWWPGLESLAPILPAQMSEFEAGGVTFEIGEVEAYNEGTVGWVAARPKLLLPDGSTASLRFTGVLHLDRGVWRFVQWHLSQGVDNVETIGFEMTTTVEHLAAAVQEERPDLASSAAADGTITIAFSDIEQSTEIALRLGDHKWLDLLRWHDDLVANHTTREGGHIVKSLGDGHMLAFPSASRALRGVTEIQRSLEQTHDGESVRVRIGLHTGEVLRQADDFFGHAVIMAARVAAEAHGNEILVSSLVRELTGSVGTFEFGEPRTASLKGIPGEHELFPLLWRGAV